MLPAGAPQAWERWGFRLAGLVSVAGVLVFSAVFTNQRLTALSPVVFSRFGLLSIVLWGFAYLAAGEVHGRPRGLLALVFAAEKLIYAVSWIRWMQTHAAELPTIFVDSPLTATFYAIYGPVDLLFGVFFSLVAARLLGRPETS